MSEVRNI